MPGETPSLGTLGAPLGPYWASVVRSPPPPPPYKDPKGPHETTSCFFHPVSDRTKWRPESPEVHPKLDSPALLLPRSITRSGGTQLPPLWIHCRRSEVFSALLPLGHPLQSPEGRSLLCPDCLRVLRSSFPLHQPGKGRTADS